MFRSLTSLVLGLVLAAGIASCGDDDKPPRPDTTPPVVTLVAPENGLATPNPRSVLFQAEATDDTGVTGVDFLFDGAIVGRDSIGTGDLYELTWENEPLSVGTHHAAARAHDAAGNSSEDTATITITPPPDTTPPEVTLITPADGLVTIVPRSTPFQARATDNTGVTHVEFLFDGEVVCQDSTGTDDLFDCTWENPPLSLGAHQAIARAYDAMGNHADGVSNITITGR